jgi:hypothetical protein
MPKLLVRSVSQFTAKALLPFRIPGPSQGEEKVLYSITQCFAPFTLGRVLKDCLTAALVTRQVGSHTVPQPLRQQIFLLTLYIALFPLCKVFNPHCIVGSRVITPSQFFSGESKAGKRVSLTKDEGKVCQRNSLFLARQEARAHISGHIRVTLPCDI